MGTNYEDLTTEEKAIYSAGMDRQAEIQQQTVDSFNNLRENEAMLALIGEAAADPTLAPATEQIAYNLRLRTTTDEEGNIVVTQLEADGEDPAYTTPVKELTPRQLDEYLTFARKAGGEAQTLAESVERQYLQKIGEGVIL